LGAACAIKSYSPFWSFWRAASSPPLLRSPGHYPKWIENDSVKLRQHLWESALRLKAADLNRAALIVAGHVNQMADAAIKRRMD